MRVLFLGTGGYHPSEERHTACVFLPEAGVVFDAGTGFFRVPSRLEGKELQVFLSHPHLDHAIGLTWFLPALKFGLVDRARVFGTTSTLEAVQNHLFGTAIFSGQSRYDFVPLPAQVEVGGSGILTYCELRDHPGGSIAYRVDWPAFSIAYVTDTTVDGSYTEFVRGVDLLIHECNFPDELASMANAAKHSHTTPVAKLARDAKAKRLILVHVDPWLPDSHEAILKTAQAIFPTTDLAHDLLEVAFESQ